MPGGRRCYGVVTRACRTSTCGREGAVSRRDATRSGARRLGRLPLAGGARGAGFRRARRRPGLRRGRALGGETAAAVGETRRRLLLLEVGVAREAFVEALHEQRRLLEREQALAQRLLARLAHALHQVLPLVLDVAQHLGDR